MKDQISDPAFGNCCLLLLVILVLMIAPVAYSWIVAVKVRYWKRQIERAIRDAQDLLRELNDKGK